MGDITGRYDLVVSAVLAGEYELISREFPELTQLEYEIICVAAAEWREHVYMKGDTL